MGFELIASDFLGAVVTILADAEYPRFPGAGEGDWVFNRLDLLGEGDADTCEGEISGTFISLSEGESFVKVLCLTGPAGLAESSLPLFFSGDGVGDDSEFEEDESGRVNVLDLD